MTTTLLLVTLVLAGCAASEGAEPQTDPSIPGPVASGEALEDAASISGIVVDDSQAPIEGAIVGILGLGLQVQTDVAGSFRFEGVPPGPHDLSAAKLGYASAGKRVTVEATQELTGVVLMLVPVVVEAAYHEIFGPYSGYFNCFVGTPVRILPCLGTADANNAVFDDTRVLSYNLSAEHWATMIGEARWAPGAVATAAGMAIYPSYPDRSGSHWWCEADGASPIWFRYEAADPEASDGLSVCNTQGEIDPEPSMDINPLRLIADPGFGGTTTDKPPLRLMLQQRFELMMSVFYGEPAPAGFSALADA